ncbi:MAG: peptidylprolyl isomerase, partial [Rhodopirellula bahusiensis]
MLVAGLNFAGPTAQVSAQPPGTDAADASGADAGTGAPAAEAAQPPSQNVDGGRVKDDPKMIADTMAEMPEDVRKEAEETYAKFKATH